MAYQRKSRVPYDESTRRKALMRLLAFVARRTGRRPVRIGFSKRVQNTINYQGGVRALLHEYARNGCPSGDRPFFDRLVASRSRRRPASSGNPYWTEVRLHRELRPYIERYLESCGRLRVTRELRRDGKHALLAATRRGGRGGIHGLFARWGIEEEIDPYISLHLQRELERLFPDHSAVGLFPTSREVSALDVGLHDFIVRYGVGYRQAAARIGFQTRRDRRAFPARRRMIEALGEHILATGGLGQKSELPGRTFETLRKTGKSIEQFLQDLALDREIQGVLDGVQARLKAAIKDGLPPDQQEGVRQAHRLFRRIIERCERP